MDIPFVIIAVITLVSGIGAISLRNLVHCALSLTLTFAGLAAFYLHLNAQFVGFAQLLVYVGAVAILIVFAILLTRGGESEEAQSPRGSWNWFGIAIAVSAFACLAGAVLSSTGLRSQATAATITVRQIGDKLMWDYALPLEVLGLLLTAALIGAVVLAIREQPEHPPRNLS